ncbi:membrane-associated proteins in eicosanoid and glutathione metabolism [Marasmius fiardii PR-910]|nr:membrane-associated proteins in eicosanoid and glutathione metabolism [Marasmius fiardii PR-910]
MSTLQIQLPEGLPLVGASLLSTVFLLIYQVSVASSARKAAKIPYPHHFADKAEEQASFEARKFNCAQRAHANTLEWLPSVYLTTFLSAVKYPEITAGLLAGWTLTRVMYTRGYASGTPEKRETGVMLGFLLQLGLLGTSLAVVGCGLKAYLGI